MKKILEVIKKAWAWFIALLKKDQFNYTFPLAIFALTAFIKWSVFFVIITAIWAVHIIVRTDEEK